MMIREMSDGMARSIRISVYLKDGRSFRQRNVPPNFFGDHERVVSFWEGDVLMVYPMRDVEHVEYHFETTTTVTV
jgi:hypothetical protein